MDRWKEYWEGYEREECYKRDYEGKRSVHGGEEKLKEEYFAIVHVWIRDLDVEQGTAITSMCCKIELYLLLTKLLSGIWYFTITVLKIKTPNSNIQWKPTTMIVQAACHATVAGI